MSSRNEITLQHIHAASNLVMSKLKERLQEKGAGTFCSRHEILGIVAEEYFELVEAVTKGKGVGDELVDVAVGCIFGLACGLAGELDW